MYNENMAVAISYTLFIFYRCRMRTGYILIKSISVKGIRIKNVSILADYLDSRSQGSG